MKYRREAVFPCKLLIGFTAEQREALEVIAERDEKSMATIVRDCVERHLGAVADRRRTEFKRVGKAGRR